MPLIISPTEAARLISGKCGGSAPDFDDEALLGILNGITSRVEAAMNVDTLTLGTHIDRFYLNDMPTLGARGPVKATVRLSNAYIQADSLIYKDEDGEELEAPTAEKVDTLYGMVDIHSWSRGYYSLEYVSGLDVKKDESDTPIEPVTFNAVPEWMKSVVAAFLVQWYRTMYLAPKAPKNVSYEQMMTALYRQIYSLVYPQYQRPRLGVVWSDRRQ